MMSGASILCSKDEWLLMNKGCYKVFFFSFSSKSIIELPNLPKSGVKFSCFTFTSSPTSKDCIVFGLSPHPSRLKYRAISISVVDKDWMSKTFERDINECPSLYPCSSNIVYHRGMFCCAWSSGVLVTFHERLDFMEVFSAARAPESLAHSYILEVDGEVVVVFTSNTCNDVWVCKWDYSNRTWHQLDDIGEYMLFVSEKTTYAKKSVNKNMRNKLYFPHVDEMNYGVFYCLKSGEFQSFRDGTLKDGIYDTYCLLESCWMG